MIPPFCAVVRRLPLALRPDAAVSPMKFRPLVVMAVPSFQTSGPEPPVAVVLPAMRLLVRVMLSLEGPLKMPPPPRELSA